MVTKLLLALTIKGAYSMITHFEPDLHDTQYDPESV